MPTLDSKVQSAPLRAGGAVADDPAGPRPERTAPHAESKPVIPATPRWVIVLAVLAGLVFLAFVVLHLTGLSPTGH